MTRGRYTLDQFIHDMTELVTTQPDQAALFETGKVSTYVLGKYDNC